MTTFEPGARLALTQGWVESPRSTAFLATQAGGDHDRGVRRVRAAGDGGDDDRAVRDVAVPQRAIGRRRGRGVLRADGRAAAAFAFQARLALLVRRLDVAGCDLETGLALGHRLEGLLERRPGLAEGDAVLRALRAGEARLDGREVEFQGVGVLGLGGAEAVEEALGLRVRLDQADRARRGGPRVPGSGGSRRRSGRCRRWRRIRGPCWRWWRGRPGAGSPGRRRRTRRTCRRRPCGAASG